VPDCAVAVATLISFFTSPSITLFPTYVYQEKERAQRTICRSEFLLFIPPPLLTSAISFTIPRQLLSLLSFIGLIMHLCIVASRTKQ
jgi:hypothetical protein